MNDLQSAKIGLGKLTGKSKQKISKFWHETGLLLSEIRKKRNKSQSDFSIPIRTVRRIEKGSEPHIME